MVAGLICDPEVARLAHAAGTGARLQAAVGAKSGFPGETPINGEFGVDALGDGRFVGTGPFYRGAQMDLGPMALLRSGDVRIAVASRKQQAADQSMFRHLGVEPAAQRILVLKSSVHFRADFGALASEILIVLAPGPSPADPAQLPFRKLRPSVRVGPSAEHRLLWQCKKLRLGAARGPLAILPAPIRTRAFRRLDSLKRQRRTQGGFAWLQELSWRASCRLVGDRFSTYATTASPHRARRARDRRTAQAHAREGWRLRHRRHHARQVHRARKVRIGARARLRLLRRRARLGFERSAV